MSDRDAFRAAREHGLKARHETREARAVRKAIADELRQLGAYRAEYCHSCPQTASDYHAMDPMALSVHEEHATAAWLADIIEGKNDARGWLPSWRWDEWAEGGLVRLAIPKQASPGSSGEEPS